MVTLVTRLPSSGALSVNSSARIDAARSNPAAQHDWFSADAKVSDARHIGISAQKLHGNDVDQLAQQVLAHISQQDDTTST
jgi:hypothetical protein